MSWFSQIWRKAGPTIAAAAAVATGNPELAAPAAAAARATIKDKKPSPPVIVPPAEIVTPAGGFAAAYRGLPQVDKEILLAGGTVLGAAILSRLLFAPAGRR